MAGEFICQPVTRRNRRDLVSLFGPKGACAGCWCMWWRSANRKFVQGKGKRNKARLRQLVANRLPVGILAYEGKEVIGWCSVAPRDQFHYLGRSKVLGPVDAHPVWSVTCFYIKPGMRRAGWATKLLRGAVEYARSQGASIVEGYPVAKRDKQIAPAFANMGLDSMFRKVGFKEVARRSPTRPIMRRKVSR